jgi:hypothetical protein
MGNGGFGLTRHGRLGFLAQCPKYPSHGADRLWQIGGGYLIVRDVSGDDFNHHLRQTCRLSVISHDIFPLIGTIIIPADPPLQFGVQKT